MVMGKIRKPKIKRKHVKACELVEAGEGSDQIQEDGSDIIADDSSLRNDQESLSGSESGEPQEVDAKDTRKKREKKKFDFERNSRTIFVGNLPTSYDKRKVSQLFRICGPVESARIRSIVPEKEKISPKVALISKRLHPKVDSYNAYVVFKTNENDETVKKALKMNGKPIEGHHIRVDRASRPKAKKETLTSRKKSVFVGNLRFDIRDDELFTFFSKVGPVNYVRLVRDSSSGLGKGFGFVVFNERVSVKKALELNDAKFKGRGIRVKKVDEKTSVKPKQTKNKA